MVFPSPMAAIARAEPIMARIRAYSAAEAPDAVLRLEFRAPDRTLTDDEVAERRTAIEKELESIGGRLRA